MAASSPTRERQGRRAAPLAALGALALGYAALSAYELAGTRPATATLRRALQLDDEDAETKASSSPRRQVRKLAKNAASPPAMDEVEGEFIIKPWVGFASEDVYETTAETALTLYGAQASSSLGTAHTPRKALENALNTVDISLQTYWASNPSNDDDGAEWFVVDMGGPVSVDSVYIKWTEAYAQNYEIQVAKEKENCRTDGTPCPDTWTTIVTVTGKFDAEPSTDEIDDDYKHDLQGVRYLRLLLNKHNDSHNNFEIYFLQVFRKPMVVDEQVTDTFCGSTHTAVTNTLLQTYGGTLIQSYENAEFFAARLTEAQKEAMFQDPCVFTVEPNYVVRARGKTSDGHGRRLAIPEFNRVDENPANWGLERISSMGAPNGRYKWIHEGKEVQIYIFDTGIYPDHSDFIKEYDGSSRLGDGLICAGSATDYQTNDHGTHVASLAGGNVHGTGKATTIHPIQVLDASGKGSTASLLCGMEQLLVDGKAFNLANAPKKIQAVVNLSLGVDGRSDALDKAVKDMTDVGYTVVIAAGDHDGNACFYSPYDGTAITVGALKNAADGKNDKTATSNYGDCIDVWAPGEDIVGASNAGEYESSSKSGTSVAAAFVAGAASLFFEEINTELYTSEEFSAKVKEKVLHKGEIGILGEIGFGSPNKIVQTTSSRCQSDAHCDVGLKCLDDGQCWDRSRPLKPSRKS